MHRAHGVRRCNAAMECGDGSPLSHPRRRPLWSAAMDRRFPIPAGGHSGVRRWIAAFPSPPGATLECGDGSPLSHPRRRPLWSAAMDRRFPISAGGHPGLSWPHRCNQLRQRMQCGFAAFRRGAISPRSRETRRAAVSRLSHQGRPQVSNDPPEDPDAIINDIRQVRATFAGAKREYPRHEQPFGEQKAVSPRIEAAMHRRTPEGGLPGVGGSGPLSSGAVAVIMMSLRRVSELARRLIRNQLPLRGLRVRVPCPPL